MTSSRTFFPSLRAAVAAGFVVAGMISASGVLRAQDAAPAPAATTQAPAADAPLAPVSAPGQIVPKTKADKKKAQAEKKAEKKEENSKANKVVQSKDTRAAFKKGKKIDPLAGKDASLPDKQLYDKAVDATKHGRFDLSRLDLQTLLNTYPDSQYQMRAKLAIADSWYKEGGTAALTQAEQEYKDFITFFPNAPEAAEAQMRVGDIYFRQMDKPDRDYAKAVHAEQEYRTMLQQFPDSTLVPDAKQRLREVQEVLATRESTIAEFYSTHSNWPATIARYQTVADTYPQYSHMDDVLLGLGDGFEAEAKYVRSLKLPEAGKARLEKVYDDQAIAAYSKIVTEHAASRGVEDAKDRLIALHADIPKPTAEQIARSEEMENSRAQYKITDRARLLVMHQPDVVTAARTGDPTLVDPKPTVAPDVTRQIVKDFTLAMNPNARPATAPGGAATGDAAAPVTDGSGTPAPAADTAAPLAFQDVPAAGTSTGASGSTMTVAPVTNGGGAPAASAGIEIVSPGSSAPIDGMKAVGPANNTPLPAIEKPADAPDTVNDIQPGQAPPAAAAPANGKKAKPEFDKNDESSNKHKKKKGLGKINPF
ncbi:outer membrane protein assembly factor BamD [Granulicella aggregans]|jgi:outer membrane protein assembly factor BamD|uniref:Outer membrane protein assembly factor BamD n=1 Tax=Granulicella aggregans TaxID=474949 RepID=A0A7W7ZAJ3_9BACT|nr:outer membrane protein assembly factor BamD [Granulicella aggregans]MBB5055796.1 outer membrane protein assembly factor BamD [Granulicella aggregans]